MATSHHSPHSPQRDPAAPFHSHPGHLSRDELRQAIRHEHDVDNARAIRKGLLWLGGFAVVAAIGGLVVWQQLSADAARTTQLAEQHTALRHELLVADVHDAKTAKQLLDRLAATEDEWQHAADAAQFAGQRTKLLAFVADASALQVADHLAQAVAADWRAGPRSTAAWQSLHDRAHDAIGKVPATAPDRREELKAQANDIDLAWFQAMVVAADDAGTDAAKALAELSAAQRLAHDCLGLHGDHRFASGWEHAQAGIALRTNAAQAAVFDDAAIAAVAWTDLIPGTEEKDWVASSGSSLLRQLKADGLHVTCSGSGHGGAVVVLRHHDWQACELALELQLDQGDATIFPRAARGFEPGKVGAVQLSVGKQDGALQVPAGTLVHVSMRFVGDTLTATIAEPSPQRLASKVALGERVGSLAIVTHPGSTLVLRKLRVRKLV